MKKYGQRYFQKRAISECLLLNKALTKIHISIFRQILDQDLVSCRMAAVETLICDDCPLKVQCDFINRSGVLLAA